MRIGGNFAPPLTDELLADYRRRIDALPLRTPLRDALELLYACALAWWNVPESTAPAKRHRVGIGKMQPLDRATIDQLWDTTPYAEECQALEPLLEQVEAETARRNGELLDKWRVGVSRLLFQEHFAGVSQATVTLYYRAAKVLSRLLPAALVNLALRAAFPDVPADSDQRWDAWQAAVKAALASPSPPIPRPELEPTPLRDCAHHLLWHAKELAADREPMTNDRL
jgi:hypothetical protein